MKTLSGTLKFDAKRFQAGESTGFSFTLGEQVYNRSTKEKSWTNYQFAVFAKSPKQIEYYERALVEGSVVFATAETLILHEYNGKTYLKGDNCTVRVISSNPSAPQNGQQGANWQQSAPIQQQPMQAPQQAPDGFDDFNDDIPFS